jgi:hypothetical protein
MRVGYQVGRPALTRLAIQGYAALQAHCGPQAHVGPQAQDGRAAAAGGADWACWQPQPQLAPGQSVHWHWEAAAKAVLSIVMRISCWG